MTYKEDLQKRVRTKRAVRLLPRGVTMKTATVKQLELALRRKKRLLAVGGAVAGGAAAVGGAIAGAAVYKKKKKQKQKPAPVVKKQKPKVEEDPAVEFREMINEATKGCYDGFIIPTLRELSVEDDPVKRKELVQRLKHFLGICDRVNKRTGSKCYERIVDPVLTKIEEENVPGKRRALVVAANGLMGVCRGQAKRTATT